MNTFKCPKDRLDYALDESKKYYDMLCQSESVTMERLFWETFLSKIHNVREAIRDTYKSLDEHNKWYSKFAHDEKNDELLVYIRNARNNVQHGISETPISNPVRFSVKDKAGKPFPMDSISQTFKDGELKISLESKDMPDDIDLEVGVSAMNADATSLTNKGKVYPPPTKHQGTIIFSIEIYRLAELALNYYQKIVADADTVTKKSAS